MIATITKEVPIATIGAIGSLFDQICNPTGALLDPSTFDWALHPGGASILQGTQHAMNLTNDRIRASLDVYQKFGNSSSPTVLIVLDKLREMGRGQDDVVATSFGPGLMIEMIHIRRCRDVETRRALSPGALAKVYGSGMSVISRLLRSGRKLQ